MSAASSSKGTGLSTEELRHLKEGDIVVGEDGKRYRVKKSLLPQHAISGPHGIGDPSDRTLRKIEADVLIPNLMNKQIERNECRSRVEDLVKCMQREGGALGLTRCTGERDWLNECKLQHFNNAEFRQRITEHYLDDRAAARRTGMTPKQRDLQKYREWKAQQDEQ